MVNGIELFQQHFAAYTDSYLLIGGSACDVHFEQAALPFRATKDLDIVLCVEALDASFVRAFWDFVKEGGYAVRQKSNGAKQFYRFMKPTNAAYPAMLELFSRKPEQLRLAEDSYLTPIPAEDEASSLSAILLNDDYYRLLMDTRMVQAGISMAPPQTLIVLKAKAWMDLRERKAAGESIDSKDIRKHRNDIARLAVIATPGMMTLPPAIAADMADFLQAYAEELPDSAALGLSVSAADLLQTLRELMGVNL